MKKLFLLIALIVGSSASAQKTNNYTLGQIAANEINIKGDANFVLGFFGLKPIARAADRKDNYKLGRFEKRIKIYLMDNNLNEKLINDKYFLSGFNNQRRKIFLERLDEGSGYSQGLAIVGLVVTIAGINY